MTVTLTDDDDLSFLDDDPFAEGQDDDGNGPADGGDDIQYLDFDANRDRRVRVKIDGQDAEVPLHEAVAGYQRQADYTRKTQELAQQRQELQLAAALKQALDNDPAGAIAALQQHYKVTSTPTAARVPTAQKAADPWSDGWDDDGEDDQPAIDPRDARLAALEARERAREEAAAAAQVEQEISRLQSRYPDFDPKEVIAQAIQMGTHNLESAYKALAYDKQLQRQAEAQNAKQAKRAASVVSGGASVPSRGKDEGQGEIRSLRDAWASAKRDLGL